MSLKPQKKVLLVALATLGLIPIASFSKSKPIMTTDLLQALSPIEPWDKSGVLTATKTANFQQTASGATDATTIAKVKLAYFTSDNCTGDKAGNGFFTTPNSSPTHTISVGGQFGLVASSAWQVGENKLSITDMTTIRSIAVTFQSSTSDVPQSNFSGSSFSCLAVTCANDACTSAAGTQSFQLKITAAAGDPANGGKIADTTTGLIATSTNDSSGITWGSTSIQTNATSDTSGLTNTGTIVTALGENGGTNYAAKLCSDHSASGGYDTWFLPGKDQLSAMLASKSAVGDYLENGYWTSTESSTSGAWIVDFWSEAVTTESTASKSGTRYVRCASTYTP